MRMTWTIRFTYKYIYIYIYVYCIFSFQRLAFCVSTNVIMKTIISIRWDNVSDLRPPKGVFPPPPGDISMKNHNGMMSTDENSCFVHQSSLAILPAVICYQAGGTGDDNDEFCLAKCFCSHLQWFFTCRKILRYGADGFTSPQKEGVLRIFIALKSLPHLPGLNPKTLGPMKAR
jgi:hypothetical protein